MRHTFREDALLVVMGLCCALTIGGFVFSDRAAVAVTCGAVGLALYLLAAYLLARVRHGR
jgi:hypothetical protein